MTDVHTDARGGVKKWLTEEERNRYLHARLLLRDSGIEFNPDWDEEDVWNVLVPNGHPRTDVDVNVLWAWRVKRFLESLAEERELSETRRALLKKHEWVVQPIAFGSNVLACPECGAIKETFQSKHTPNCAIATALKGVGGE